MEAFSRLDEKTVAALYRLQSPEMAPVLTLFKKLQQESDTALRRAKSDTFGQLQGRAMLLEEILEQVEKSQATLEKLRQK